MPLFMNEYWKTSTDWSGLGQLRNKEKREHLDQPSDTNIEDIKSAIIFELLHVNAISICIFIYDDYTKK